MKSFFQASWLHPRTGERVYGDIYTANDKARMEIPSSAAGVQVAMGHADNLIALRKANIGADRSFFEPTPRSDRR